MHQKSGKTGSHPNTIVPDVESELSEEELLAAKALHGVLEDVKSSSKLNEITQAILEAELSPRDFRRLLIKNLNIINSREDIYNLTPIHLAVLCRNREYLKELVRLKGIDINAKSYSNITALAFACDMRDIPTIDILMQHIDIDINIRDVDGICPLELALEALDIEMIKLLLRRTTARECNRSLPKIHIMRESSQKSLFIYLNLHRACNISAKEILQVANLLLVHGEKISKVYKLFKKSCRLYMAKQPLVSVGPLEQAILVRNPELLYFFLQNLQRAFSPPDLQFLWKLHLKCINESLHDNPGMKDTSVECVNGNRIAKILFGFVKMYEGVTNMNIPLCTTFVGGRRY